MLNPDATQLGTSLLSSDNGLSAYHTGLNSKISGPLDLELRPSSPLALNSVSIDGHTSETWNSDWVDSLLNDTFFQDDFSFPREAFESQLNAQLLNGSLDWSDEVSDPLTGSNQTIGTDAVQSDILLDPQSLYSSYAQRPRYLQGNLLANRFSANLNEALTVISGNGNVEYGENKYDYLDLSHISTQSVTSWSPAESQGVLFNTGKGDRIFDSLQFSNGSQVIFEGLDAVRFADGLLDLTVNPDDPLFNDQWNLHMMGVHNAWRFTQGSDNVAIGVQDSGLGISPGSRIHADLTNTASIDSNVTDDFLADFDSHGTSVQSIISAASNNGLGMSGINWHSDVINIDVLDNARGDLSLTAATQEMINYASSQGQRLIVNMSLGAHDFFDNDFASLVANNQHNALFVVASGNEDVSWLAHPADLAQRYDNVISVGASWGKEDRSGKAVNVGDRIHYSNRGANNNWGSNYGHGLSLMGPSEVIAATATNTQSGVHFGMQDDFGGTSAATPNVAGVASLVWSVNPNLSATQVHQIMQETAYDLGAQGYDWMTGHGFVNADAAVRRAMAIGRAAASSWFSTFDTHTPLAQRTGDMTASEQSDAALASFTTASVGSLEKVKPNTLLSTQEASSLDFSTNSILSIPTDLTNMLKKPILSVETGTHLSDIVDTLSGMFNEQIAGLPSDWLTEHLHTFDNPLLQFSTDSLLNPDYSFAA